MLTSRSKPLAMRSILGHLGLALCAMVIHSSVSLGAAKKDSTGMLSHARNCRKGVILRCQPD